MPAGNGVKIDETGTTSAATDASAGVSLSQSVVMVASSSVTSGDSTGTTVTLTLKDKDGNRYTKTSGLRIEFTYLSNGTSTGSFTSPTEISPGVYTSKFVGYAAGTASSIMAVVNGKMLTSTLPTITVEAGSVSVSQSSISVSSSIVINGTATAKVYVTLKDAQGNLVSGVNVGSIAAAFGATGTSSGTFGAFSAVSGSPGMYQSTITATTAGTSNTITATYSGSAINGSASVLIKAGSMTLTAASSTVTAGQPLTYTIKILDSNSTLVSGFAGTFSVSVPIGCTGTASTVSVTMASTDGGQKTFQNTCTVTGSVTLTASHTGLANATADVTVTPAAAASLTFTQTPGATASGAAFAAQPIITLKDVFSNTVTSGVDATATVTLSIYSGTGTLTGTTSVAAVSGVATFAGVAIAATAGGTFKLKAQKNNTLGQSNGSDELYVLSGDISITATPPNRLRFGTASPTTIYTNNYCNGPYTVESVYHDGSSVIGTANVTANTTVALTHNAGTAFYSDSACTSVITERTISAGSSATSSFYFKAVAATATLTADDTNPATLTDGTLAQTTKDLVLIFASPLTFGGSAPTTYNAICNGPYYLRSRHAGADTAVPAQVTATLGIAAGTGTFHAVSGCSDAGAVTKTATFSSGFYISDAFYFKPSVVGATQLQVNGVQVGGSDYVIPSSAVTSISFTPGALVPTTPVITTSLALYLSKIDTSMTITSAGAPVAPVVVSAHTVNENNGTYGGAISTAQAPIIAPTPTPLGLNSASGLSLHDAVSFSSIPLTITATFPTGVSNSDKTCSIKSGLTGASCSYNSLTLTSAILDASTSASASVAFDVTVGITGGSTADSAANQIYIRKQKLQEVSNTTGSVSVSDNPKDLTLFNSKLYFSAANDESSSTDIYRKVYHLTDTDGNAATENDVTLTLSSTTTSNDEEDDNPQSFTVGGNYLYFVGKDEDAFTRLYNIDTSDVVQQVSGLNASGNDSPTQLTYHSGVSKLFFAASDGTGNYLYQTDGTEIAQQTGINPDGDEPMHFTQSSARLYFAANTSTGFRRVYATTGAINTVPTPDEVTNYIHPSVSFDGDDAPQNLTYFNGRVYFVARSDHTDDASNQDGGKAKLFSAPEGATTAAQVTNEHKSGSQQLDDDPRDLTVLSPSFGSRLYFSARTTAGRKLYSYTGANLKQYPTSDGDDDPKSFMAGGGYVYFTAKNSSGMRKVFAADAANSFQVSNTSSGGNDNPTMIGYFTLNGASRMYFTANNANGVPNLYSTDGSTNVIQHTNFSLSSNSFRYFVKDTVNNKRLYFVAKNNNGFLKLFSVGYEQWSSDSAASKSWDLIQHTDIRGQGDDICVDATSESRTTPVIFGNFLYFSGSPSSGVCKLLRLRML